MDQRLCLGLLRTAQKMDEEGRYVESDQLVSGTIKLAGWASSLMEAGESALGKVAPKLFGKGTEEMAPGLFNKGTLAVSNGLSNNNPGMLRTLMNKLTSSDIAKSFTHPPMVAKYEAAINQAKINSQYAADLFKSIDPKISASIDEAIVGGMTPNNISAYIQKLIEENEAGIQKVVAFQNPQLVAQTLNLYGKGAMWSGAYAGYNEAKNLLNKDQSQPETPTNQVPNLNPDANASPSLILIYLMQMPSFYEMQRQRLRF
jgi:hypothetical protein